MAQRGRYQGHGIGLVDDKGRVAIPSSLRATLAANAPRADGKGGGSIVIGAHESAKCLLAYDPAYIDVLADDVARRTADSLSGGRYDDNIRRAAASGEEVPFDGSGRFVMPDFPRFHAGIGEHAFFYGQFDFIEIWNPRVVLDTDGLPDVMKNMVTFYMKQKGIVL